MKKDFFAHKAHSCGQNPDRVNNVSNIATVARQAGFENVEVVSASVIKRETGDYPVFLLIASRV
ncbi:hypothetical protein LCGC14_0969740 [marine sediment metagenome]|uniref:Uncharacterized protein n=1 Tax=marine sediment metagenome TaxID=412755 RepID=A0A0F9QV66_9ZZZZ|nr:hypothetical protein [Marinobacter antarcticus]